jgi:hypothetical protein
MIFLKNHERIFVSQVQILFIRVGHGRNENFDYLYAFKITAKVMIAIAYSFKY